MIDYDGPVTETASSGHALAWSDRTDTKHFATTWLSILYSLGSNLGYDYDDAAEIADKVLERYKEIYNGK